MLNSIFNCCNTKNEDLLEPLIKEYDQLDNKQMEMNENICIYILECEEGKRYIGRVNNKNDVEKRFNKHLIGEGSYFCKKYKPIKIERIIENVNIFDEDARVIEYMDKYSINSVRGGIYSQIVLSDEQEKEILRKIRGATDKCLECGSDNHFVGKCPDLNIDVSICERCGRNSHNVERCYARYHLDGNLL